MDGRGAVAAATRVVVKVGSSSLTTPDGRIDGDRVDTLADALASERASGRTVVLVSSGAIAAGFGPLGRTTRPRDLATLQAAASVGQGLLVHRYAEAFGRHGLTVGQILLTADDVVRRAHYVNARRTLDRLLALGVLPVVNENDTVATDEIRFGDNDRLAALVAHLVRADLLLLLSDVDGLYDADPRRPGARRIDEVTGAADLDGIELRTAGARGTGGMATKVEAARLAAASGIPAVVGDAGRVGELLRGEGGTLFHPTGRRISSRLLWLAYASAPRGRLHLDAGAVEAVTAKGRSLLPAGVTAVEGGFDAGDPVELVGPDGRAVARGIAGYAAAELPDLLGRDTREVRAREVVHRDDLVVAP